MNEQLSFGINERVLANNEGETEEIGGEFVT